MPKITLEELCQKLKEPYEGDGTIELNGVAEITSAKDGELSFVANPKYVGKIQDSRASALIIHKDLQTDFLPVIRSENPYLTFTKALHLFHQDNRPTSGGVHPSCQISPLVTLGSDITIMPHTIIEENVTIGDRVVIYPGVFIGENVKIGNDVTLYPHVSIAAGCEIQHSTILHSGCRIGDADSVTESGDCPVRIASNVELGANVVVSGLPQAMTMIDEGTKIDNLVQIGAGTQIGKHCIIVAQVTIGEHVTFGERVTIAGQVVIVPNVTIGDFSRIGAKSTVTEDVPPKSDYWGTPAQPHSNEKRLKANLARLPRLFEKIKTLESEIGKERHG